jgi:hypothetical protein
LKDVERPEPGFVIPPLYVFQKVEIHR